jgi:hypothetical protein
MPPLVVLSQYVHGRIFMKALPAANSSGMVKKDAAGRIVPPRYRFCERMEALPALSFQRTTEYKLMFDSEFGPDPQGPDNMESRFNILIHDANLTEPTSATCSGRSCTGHGSVDMHAVPFVAAVRDNNVTEFDVWDQYETSDLIPRAFFAGCENVLIYRHTLHPMSQSGLPRFFFTFSANEVCEQELDDWEESNSRELRCLVAILCVLQADVRACAARNPEAGLQVVTRLQPSSDASETENLRRNMGGDWTTDHELFSEEVAADTRLVSKEDAARVRLFTEQEGMPATDLLASRTV